MVPFLFRPAHSKQPSREPFPLLPVASGVLPAHAPVPALPSPLAADRPPAPHPQRKQLEQTFHKLPLVPLSSTVPESSACPPVPGWTVPECRATPARCSDPSHSGSREHVVQRFLCLSRAASFLSYWITPIGTRTCCYFSLPRKILNISGPSILPSTTVCPSSPLGQNTY